MTTTHFHNCGFAVPQINTVPSILWATLQAPVNAVPTERYAGHLPDGSGVQRHSADALYLLHGATLRCVESEKGRRLWQCLNRDGVVIAAHPKHNACYLLAIANLTGA